MFSKATTQIVTILVTMLALDAFWLTSTAASTREMFARVQKEPLQFRYGPAAIVYVLMTIGLYFFVVDPANTWVDAAWKGALLGLVVYGTYDWTNYATLKYYTPQFAITDMLWGSVLFGVTAAIAKYATTTA
jgi:uncharacterized membrane protein